MITIKATKRTKEVLIEVPRHTAKHKKGLFNGLGEAGKDVVTEIRRLIRTGPKTGRVYKFRGAPHQASAPGEPPANRSGRLMRSSRFKVRNWQEMTVGETAEYAGYLEDGTRGRMAPRPHIIKAVNNKAQDTANNILEAVKREIRA
jgi:hypothetical protein